MVAKLKRTKTHIPGFDQLVEGGFPKGSNVLVLGSAGTGKTILSMQYLYNGAMKEREVGVYFTFEEKRSSLIAQAAQFGWDLQTLENKKKLRIISIGTEDITKTTIDEMIEIIKTLKAKRVVIDSITTLAYLNPTVSSEKNVNLFVIKKFLYGFLSRLSELEDLSSLIISQKGEEVSSTVSEYLCDGVINIEYESLGGDYSRNLIIRKMRKTKNDEDLHPMEISNKGIKIHTIE